MKLKVTKPLQFLLLLSRFNVSMFHCDEVLPLLFMKGLDDELENNKMCYLRRNLLIHHFLPHFGRVCIRKGSNGWTNY